MHDCFDGVVSSSFYSMEHTPCGDGKRRSGRLDEVDGAKNQTVMETLADWKSNYPAFAWCGEYYLLSCVFVPAGHWGYPLAR